MDVYSATNSSPWTAFKFANDKDAEEALWYYVKHAIAITGVINIGGAIIARSWIPIIGATLASAYMYWLYYDAVEKGKEKETTSWQAEGKAR